MTAVSFRRLFALLVALAIVGAIVGFEWAGSRKIETSVSEPQPKSEVRPQSPAKPLVRVLSLSDLVDGRLKAKGDADPDVLVRLYLNGLYLGAVTAGPDGQWAFTTEHGIPQGHNIIRSDVVDRTGALTARAEVKFFYQPEYPPPRLPPIQPSEPTTAASNAAPSAAPAEPAPSSAPPKHVPSADDLLKEVTKGASPMPPIVASNSPPATEAPPLPPHSPTPSELMNGLGEQLRDLPKGKIFLDAPSTMMVSESREVEARVGIDVPLEMLKVRPSAGAQSVSGDLSVSSQMTADLTGAGFEITAQSPKRQSVARGFPTVWRWNVKASEDGDRELEATLRALVPNGDPDGQFIDSFKATVKVSVRPLTWTESLKSLSEDVGAAQGIAVAIVAAATGILGWFGLSKVKQRRSPLEAARKTKPTRLRNEKAAS